MTDYTLFSDDRLRAMALEGDDFAEEALAERYSRLVKICLRPFFLAGGDSEDLMQEGMLGLLSAIRRYDPHSGASFKTFAEHCIRNRLLTAIKTATRKKHDPLNDGVSLDAILSEETALPQEVARRITEDKVLARESEEEFYSTFSRCMSQFERDVLKRYLSGLSYREIAESMGRSEKSVDNAVQRLRRKLASNPYLGDFSDS